MFSHLPSSKINLIIALALVCAGVLALHLLVYDGSENQLTKTNTNTQENGVSTELSSGKMFRNSEYPLDYSRCSQEMLDLPPGKTVYDISGEVPHGQEILEMLREKFPQRCADYVSAVHDLGDGIFLAHTNTANGFGPNKAFRGYRVRLEPGNVWEIPITRVRSVVPVLSPDNRYLLIPASTNWDGNEYPKTDRAEGIKPVLGDIDLQVYDIKEGEVVNVYSFERPFVSLESGLASVWYVLESEWLDNDTFLLSEYGQNPQTGEWEVVNKRRIDI